MMSVRRAFIFAIAVTRLLRPIMPNQHSNSKIAVILAAPPAERITLTQLARQEGVAPSSSYRWATKGVRGRRLPTAMVGSKRVTTRAIYVEWCEQLTAATNGAPTSEVLAAGLHNDEELRIARAESQLARLGLDCAPSAASVNSKQAGGNR